MSIRMMTRRPHSRWRKVLFSRLAERDGRRCRECRRGDSLVWRKGGLSNDGDWANEPVCRNLLTRVIPTSILEIDHRVPLSLGGSNDLNNLQLLCGDCHRAKTACEQALA